MSLTEPVLETPTSPIALTEATQDEMPNDAQPCRVFEIAPELRNNIYSLVLASPHDILIPASGRLATPALLNVCQQVRQEATQLYYAENTFKVVVRDDA